MKIHSFKPLIAAAIILTSMSTSLQARETGGSCQPEDFLEGKINSNVFSLSAEEVLKINPDDIGIELATSIVEAIGAAKGCSPSQMGIDATRSDCSEIVPGFPASSACYIDSGAGQFFVVFDPLDEGANVIYNRLD